MQKVFDIFLTASSKIFSFSPAGVYGRTPPGRRKRRNRQLEVHGTQGNEGVAYDTDDDQMHAMEEDHDQDQGEDHCTSMIYSNGQSTNTLNRKQRKILENKISRSLKQRIRKVRRKKNGMNNIAKLTHNFMHLEEEDMV